MCFSTILSRVLDKYFVYMPPTPLSNGPSVNKVLSCLGYLSKTSQWLTDRNQFQTKMISLKVILTVCCANEK